MTAGRSRSMPGKRMPCPVESDTAFAFFFRLLFSSVRWRGGEGGAFPAERDSSHVRTPRMQILRSEKTARCALRADYASGRIGPWRSSRRPINGPDLRLIAQALRRVRDVTESGACRTRWRDAVRQCAASRTTTARSLCCWHPQLPVPRRGARWRSAHRHRCLPAVSITWLRAARVR